jgi:universal stress protein E
VEHLKKLLVIVDPDNDKDYVIDRAILIAFSYRSQVLLLMNKSNVLTQDTADTGSLSARFFSSQKQHFIEHYQSKLASLKERFEAQGITADTLFSTDKNAANLLLRKIREFGPDLTLKSIQKQGRLARILITNTDWKLVKNCPSPLLLVKAQPWAEDGCIMASVDPMHSKSQQNHLDHLLLDTTVRLAKSMQLNSRVFHCYFPDMSTMFPKVTEADRYIRKVKAAHWAKLTELIALHNISEDDVIMVRGDVAKTLAQVTKRERANVLVLGALSRNAVEHAIVGSTAEKILYDTPCDVLVMKQIQQV